MDEPLCFVHFINALACSHKESGGHCSAERGVTEMPAGCSCSPNLFSLGRAAGRSMGSSLWALTSLVLHGAGEKVTSRGRPNFRH